jgi:hypothetical protein
MYHPLQLEQLRVDAATRDLLAERARRTATETPRRARRPRRARGLVIRLALSPVGLTPRADTAPCPTC